jgi:4-amino-4-deoxy-L-arabinose transferase-like glycosyltransferase
MEHIADTTCCAPASSQKAKQLRLPTLTFIVCLLTAGLFLALGAAVIDPIRTAIEIGGDEHFELTKAHLWYRGHPLYSRVWNDQPPVHTAMLLGAFKLFGVGIVQARCVAAAFGLALYAACFLLVRRELGVISGIGAMACLIIAPGVFRLSITAMLELPAIAVGLWSLWALPPERAPHKYFRLIAAGILYGIALQIKMTAAVLAPGLLTYILLQTRIPGLGLWLRCSVKALIVFGSAWAVTFLLIGSIFGIDYGQAWYSHFSTETADSLSVQEKALDPRIFLMHWDGVCGAAIALLLMTRLRKLQAAAVPCVLLVTAFGIHILHKPWWGYYYLHFAVPLAWLTAYALTLLYGSVWRRRENFSSPRLIACLIIASILICCIAVKGLPRFGEELSRIRSLPRREDDALLARMRTYAGETKYAFALNSTIYPFYAGIEVIPELAVLPAKRFWSRQFSAHQVWVIVREYKPEQIILRRTTPPQLEEFLSQNYQLTYEDTERRLYVANRIAR